jgi:hypothetical protein
MLDLIWRERTKLVIFKPVVDGLAQEIKHHADMVPIVKAVIQVQAFAKRWSDRHNQIP